MKRCAACNKEITLDRFIGRRETCPYCGADLHSCRNCDFYTPGVYNDCKEPQADRVPDKERSNFCDFFRFREIRPQGDETTANPKDKLEAMFKK